MCLVPMLFDPQVAFWNRTIQWWPTLTDLVDTWVLSKEKLRYMLMPLLDKGNLDECIKAVELSCHTKFGNYFSCAIA